jgi:hypothetical protein
LFTFVDKPYSHTIVEKIHLFLVLISYELGLKTIVKIHELYFGSLDLKRVWTIHLNIPNTFFEFLLTGCTLFMNSVKSSMLITQKTARQV